MAKTVIALYNDVERARNAVQDLLNHDFQQSDVSVMSRTEGEAQDLLGQDMERVRVIEPTGVDHEKREDNVAAGAGIGAALGGIGGFFVGAGMLFVPGIGPILAAGPLVAALTGAAVGLGVGALVGALANMGVPEDEARTYAEGVRRGGILVAVAAPEERANEAAVILAHHSPVDLRKQVETWREAGWRGYDPQAKPLTREEIERERATFPVVEEHDRPAQREMESGVRSMDNGKKN